MKIGFNKPHVTGNEISYIQEAIERRKLSGNGFFTNKCQKFFEDKYKFRKCLLTTSCTDALEMAAILIDIQPGDEVIVPAYTFVSTANAFVLRGARIVFADSRSEFPCLDAFNLTSLITAKTKAIVVVHYAGVACDMNAIMEIARKHNLFVVEDAAQAIDSYFNERPLGGIGHLGAFSFHETKNVISGEGGLLVINDERFLKRAEIIWEKGTNRSAFFKGEIDKYGWVDIGSSFLPSEIIAAFLFAQIECLDDIQVKRKKIWQLYYEGLHKLAANNHVGLPIIPTYATNNAHMFYILCKDEIERDKLISYLNSREINTVFHYLSLNKSPYYTKDTPPIDFVNSDRFEKCLLRLPFYYDLDESVQDFVIKSIYNFYQF